MKTYNIVVSFGDGRPKKTTIKAKNGLDAQDQGFKKYPGARSVSIVGSADKSSKVTVDQVQQMTAAPHPLFGFSVGMSLETAPKVCIPGGTFVNKNPLLQQAFELRQKGLSYKKIGLQLEVGATTVRRWLTAI